MYSTIVYTFIIILTIYLQNNATYYIYTLYIQYT